MSFSGESHAGFVKGAKAYASLERLKQLHPAAAALQNLLTLNRLSVVGYEHADELARLALNAGCEVVYAR